MLCWRSLYCVSSVTLTIKSRIVTVKGPRGELVRNFKHCSLDMTLIEDGDKLQMDMWFATKKQLSALGSVMSHINNMMVGVVQVRFQLACPLLGIARGCWRSRGVGTFPSWAPRAARRQGSSCVWLGAG